MSTNSRDFSMPDSQIPVLYVGGSLDGTEGTVSLQTGHTHEVRATKELYIRVTHQEGRNLISRMILREILYKIQPAACPDGRTDASL